MYLGRVGKTSILLRYIKGEYDDRQVSTLQASYLDKKMILENTKVQLSLWDTAGQERFHALGPIYYRDADGALLVYDITDEESFKKVKTWVKELRRIVGEEIDISIAGNKIDLQRNRKVDEEEAKKFANSVGATHYNTSAKLNRGLEEVFTELTKRMLIRSSNTKKKTSTPLIADDDHPSPPTLPSSHVPKDDTRGSGHYLSHENIPRSRGGARGQALQIVEDDDEQGTANFGGVRIRGVSSPVGGGSMEKQKSSCC
jgi:Ras-related protein Rab-21